MTFKRFVTVFVLMAALAAIVPAALAQEVQTETITEEAINESYRITNPYRDQLSGLYVDLQPGQAVLTGTYTSTQSGESWAFSITYVPGVVAGDVQWMVTEALVNGAPANQEQLDALNEAISNSWVAWWRGRTDRRNVQSVSISDTEVTYTYTVDPREGGADYSFEDGVLTGVLTEAQLNNSYRVTNPYRDSVNNIVVDLQPGQVWVSADMVFGDGSTGQVVTTYAPAVVDGDIDWVVVNVTVNGQPATAEQLETINQRLNNTWLSWWQGRIERGNVTSLVITDSDLTYTLELGGGRQVSEGVDVDVEDGALNLSITEQAINDSYRFTNPARQTVSDVFVDLQPGQVFISATFTPRRGDAFTATVTLVPSLSDGDVTWTTTSVTVNGQPATDSQLAQINTALVNSWAAWWQARIERGTVTSVSVTDSEILYTLTR